MRYYLDSEFIENGKTIELISIAIVCEDGREFYAENIDCDKSLASDWVKLNVIPHLWSEKLDKSDFNKWSQEDGSGGLLSHIEIGREIKKFCNPVQYGKPEFWGYYADYDWIVFCQLFGTMMQLPGNYPMYCNDLKQLCVQVGDPVLPDQGGSEHHALNDARWNFSVWNFLNEYSKTKTQVVADNLPINTNWTDDQGCHQGGTSTGIGYTIAWQRGALNISGRNGAFVIEVLESVLSQIEYFNDGKFACDENTVAIELITEARDLLVMRRDRRKIAGTLGTHEPEKLA